MDGFNEWLSLLNNLAEFANHVTNPLREFTINPDPDPEKQAYHQRVRTRRRNKEERPEWDHIGRCIWHFNQNVPNIIRMEYVPQDVQDTFSSILYGRAASGQSATFSQITSDQHYTYLMEAGQFQGGVFVFFWSKPN